MQSLTPFWYEPDVICHCRGVAITFMTDRSYVMHCTIKKAPHLEFPLSKTLLETGWYAIL